MVRSRNFSGHAPKDQRRLITGKLTRESDRHFQADAPSVDAGYQSLAKLSWRRITFDKKAPLSRSRLKMLFWLENLEQICRSVLTAHFEAAASLVGEECPDKAG